MTILAAIDGERSPDPVLTTAYDLATAHATDMVALHVMDDEDFTSRQTASEVDGEPGYFLDHAVSEARTVAEDVVDATLGEGGTGAAAEDGAGAGNETGDGYVDRVTVEGEIGHPAKLVKAYAKRLDARYLVIGGRKRTPAGKALFGSLTQSILLHADRPVVTVMAEE